MAGEDVPSYVKLAEEKVRWDAEQKKKKQELLAAKKVIIKGIGIPFWDLVTLLVKIAFAAIPAAIIVAIIWGIIISFLGNILR
jgi:hypothetical protein